MVPTIGRTRITGSREAVVALRKLPKEIRNETRRDIRRAVRPIQAAAKANIPGGRPLSGWGSWQGGRLAWDSGKAKSGIGIQIGGGKQSDESWRVVTLTQRNAAGAVFETAGRRSGGKGAQGRAFVRGIRGNHGAASRAVWRAVDAAEGDIVRSVETATRDAMRRVSEFLNT
jgi:hypothetical protein